MKRILIADDQAHVLRILAQSLEREGYRVDSVQDGRAALERVREDPPDVLITDIDMPRMTGEQLCKQIVGEMPQRCFRIYVMTSRTEAEHRHWAAEIDNLEFLEKPLSLRRLSNTLLDYFTGPSARRRETA
jgi:chemosensory pili system protein ChpA (sensor histidine kinase/response regulator)